jgi:hypothetical protein
MGRGESLDGGMLAASRTFVAEAEDQMSHGSNREKRKVDWQ